jgi:hypothetical protein
VMAIRPKHEFEVGVKNQRQVAGLPLKFRWFDLGCSIEAPESIQAT